MAHFDTSPNSYKDSNVNSNVKTMEGKGIRVCSLIRNISKVKGVCSSSVMGIRMNNKRVNYSYGPT